MLRQTYATISTGHLKTKVQPLKHLGRFCLVSEIPTSSSALPPADLLHLRSSCNPNFPASTRHPKPSSADLFSQTQHRDHTVMVKSQPPKPLIANPKTPKINLQEVMAMVERLEDDDAAWRRQVAPSGILVLEWECGRLCCWEIS